MGWLRSRLRLEPDEPGTIEDPSHGPVLVTPGRPYVVSSPALGTLELDTAKRTAEADGLTGEVRPSRAIGRRGADDCTVRWDGHELHLHHTRRRRAVLELDGVTVARLEQVKQHRMALDGWRTTYEVHWEREVDPPVALLGHALASRYGVGADGAFLRFLQNVTV